VKKEDAFYSLQLISGSLSLSFYKASVASSAFSLPSVLIAICGCV